MTAKTHSLIPTFKDQLDRGQISRREFVRLSALLGLSVGAACAIGGIAPPAHAADNSPFPPVDPKAKSGGVVRIGHSVAKMDDPATYSWNETVNQTRPILECMFALGADNIIKPFLVESWEPSSDLKVWTLRLRKGVMWHNGEELIADHIVWNVKRWTDSATASSSIGLSTFAAMAQTTGTGSDGKPVMKPREGAVEVLDSHTLRFNLSTPVLSVPEDCAEKTTMIVHPSFTSPFSDKPMGTGPFTLAELKVGDKCVLKRVKTTADGKPFTYWGGEVYLDEIHFFNFESENQPAAVSDGSIDIASELAIDQIEFAKGLDTAEVLSVDTANTLCLRMQVDQKPFDDIRVRRAIVKAADNEAIRALIFPEGGSVGYNFHVGPAHPEYFELPPLQRDVEGAKALLAEAGHGGGLDITITVGNTDGPWHQAVCEALRDQLKEAGINLSINVLPPTKFWEVWDKVPFGATPWDHRPLGTMALSQAYRSGVPWNETHFSDPEFDKALAEAGATFDVAARRAKMEKVEKILQDAAVMVQPFYRPIYGLASKKVHGYFLNPARQMQLNRIWIDA